MDLKAIRRKIDLIDSRILDLLSARAELTLDIGKQKAKRKESVYVPDREKDVYKKVVSGNKGPLSSAAVKAIYREIMSGSLELEKPLTIAYLGPEFTFTHLASLKKFGSSVNYVGCATIKDVFSDVEKERADYGVVPIENSIEGAVNHTLDMFIDSDLKICSEVFLEISHDLLSKESDKSRIKKIYSKDQVFGQCRLWLEANLPRVELVEVASTAKAAMIASREKGAACIASKLAGRKYGLKTLYASIEDSPHNVTRFLVIGTKDANPTRDDKTSVMLTIKDKVGALHDILVPFKKNRINLTKIESRPSKTRVWEYFFFVDMEGHYRDPKIARALAELKDEAAYLKILGSYPKAGKD
ncbi:MAG: prephenate dehydratase [Candidatus Omnitrophica bacterium]|nr:prephenate dehydratase [Candidatus Omnitrophota bacterium]